MEKHLGDIMLQVISASRGDFKPAAVDTTKSGAYLRREFGSIYRWTDGALHHITTYNSPDVYAEARRRLDDSFSPAMSMDRLLTTKNFVHVADLAAEASYVTGHNPR